MASKQKSPADLFPLTVRNTFFPFAVLLFVFLFIYLIFRAIFNEPIQDELSSFSIYIQSGLPHNRNVAMDANNHLLNTYLSAIVYFFSGSTDTFWMRLPNLLSFPLYFFSLYMLLKRLNTSLLRYTALVALTCIPFLLEYFAYCRGYGLSFAFLTFSLLQLVRFLNDDSSPSSFGWGIISILLGASANLALLPLCLFIFGYFLLTSLLRKRRDFHFILWFRVLPALLFAGGFMYLLAYSFQLKKAGALYWGGEEGLWVNTAFSLVKYILFHAHMIWKYFLITSLIVFIFHVGRLLFRERSSAFRRTDFTFIVLFLGMLLFLQAGFLFLGLKYPLDRGALHLAILFLLCLVFVLDYWRIGKVLHWSFLCLLVPFVANINLHSSVYSAGDRMTDKLYSQIQPYLDSHTSILCNKHLARSFYYQERRNNQFHFAASDTVLPVYSDIWIALTDLQPKAPNNYRLIAQDKAANIAVYRRIESAKVIRVASKGNKSVVRQSRETNTCELIPRSEVLPGLNESIAIDLKGHFSSPAEVSNMDLAIGGFDREGTCVYFSSTSLRIWLQDRKIEHNFHTKINLEGFGNKATQLVVYLVSPTGEKLIIKNLSYQVLIVN